MARCAAGPDGCAGRKTVAVEGGRCSCFSCLRAGDKDATETVGDTEAAFVELEDDVELEGVELEVGVAHGGGILAPVEELVTGDEAGATGPGDDGKLLGLAASVTAKRFVPSGVSLGLASCGKFKGKVAAGGAVSPTLGLLGKGACEATAGAPASRSSSANGRRSATGEAAAGSS
jgi:hypothetical protein